MYVRTPSSSGGSRMSGVSNTSTPSQAPRSIHEGEYPQGPRTPNTPFTPNIPGSAGPYAPFVSPHYGGNHNTAYGLMTPPSSPDKSARGAVARPNFHPMFDAAGQPFPFDVRTGPMVSPQHLQAPIINHPVARMLVYVGGLYTFEVIGRSIPTVSEFSGQLVSATRRNASALGKRAFFAGLTLRSVEGGVAVCDLHLRSA